MRQQTAGERVSQVWQPRGNAQHGTGVPLPMVTGIVFPWSPWCSVRLTGNVGFHFPQRLALFYLQNTLPAAHIHLCLTVTTQANTGTRQQQHFEQTRAHCAHTSHGPRTLSAGATPAPAPSPAKSFCHQPSMPSLADVHATQTVRLTHGRAHMQADTTSGHALLGRSPRCTKPALGA